MQPSPPVARTKAFKATEAFSQAAHAAGGVARELLVVTMKASFAISFTARTGGRSGRGFPRVRERTYEVDATTGQTGLSGGKALPSGTPRVVTFRGD